MNMWAQTLDLKVTCLLGDETLMPASILVCGYE